MDESANGFAACGGVQEAFELGLDEGGPESERGLGGGEGSGGLAGEEGFEEAEAEVEREGWGDGGLGLWLHGVGGREKTEDSKKAEVSRVDLRLPLDALVRPRLRAPFSRLTSRLFYKPKEEPRRRAESSPTATRPM